MCARRFANRWEDDYPGAVNCLRKNLDDLLQFLRFKDPQWRKAVRTTNAIERFFRGFNRFYKVRCGFHSKESAIDQLCIFLVGYLFTKRAKDGTAPIEAVWPEASQTPLYRLINDPFGMQERLQNVKEMPKMADEAPAVLLQA